jgi:hypothetical protein
MYHRAETRVTDLWMDAVDGSGGRRTHALAIEIKPILFPVRGPSFLKNRCLLHGGDAESSKRQNHGANTYVRFRAFANMATPGAPEDWGTDTTFQSNTFEHRIQLISQFHEGLEGRTLRPLGAQPLNHFREPDALGVSRRHV